MRVLRGQRGSSSERGSALLMISVATTGLIGLSFGLALITHASMREQRQDKEDVRANYACQAGLASAMYELARGGSGTLGSANAPIAWGDSRYWVSRTDPAIDLIRLEVTGRQDRSGARAELVVRRVPNTIWRFGAFGSESVTVDGNARVDSYDSTNGSYASQAVNGSGAQLHAAANGDVGSNGAITVEHDALVWGDATAGPSNGTTVLGSAAVSGTTTPASDGVELPDARPTSGASFGSLEVVATNTIPASDRSYARISITAGQTLTIVGPATIVVDDLELAEGATLQVDSTSGPVQLWVTNSLHLGDDAAIAPLNERPNDLQLTLAGEMPIDAEGGLGAGSRIVGRVYAPEAQVEIRSAFQLFGALVAKSVALSADAQVHFDEELLTSTAAGRPKFETVCWRELAYSANGGAAGGAGH